MNTKIPLREGESAMEATDSRTAAGNEKSHALVDTSSLERAVDGICDEVDLLRETLASHCACTHDGRGDLETECQEHEAIRTQRDALLRAYRQAINAARDVLVQFDAGLLVRNTDSDGCSDWAIKAAAPLRALAALRMIVAKAGAQ